MPGFVGFDRDILAQDRVESQTGQGVLDGAIGGGQVVVAGGDQDLHVGVLGHGVAQGVGRRRVSHLVLEVPLADSARRGCSTGRRSCSPARSRM